MTVTDLARTNGHDLTDAEARAAAQDLVRQADSAGESLCGADVGRRFGRTDRWGRKQISLARRTDEGPAPGTTTAPTPRNVVSVPPGTGVGHVPAGTPDPTDRMTTGRSKLDTLAMLVVALVALAASYGHMLEVATTAGESIWIARMFPITVDGVVFIALRLGGPEGRWWLALGIAVSIAANVAAADPTIEGRLAPSRPRRHPPPHPLSAEPSRQSADLKARLRTDQRRFDFSTGAFRMATYEAGWGQTGGSSVRVRESGRSHRCRCRQRLLGQ
ncbi:MAG TPA: DUF2637 domain-containing protein [Acidimicrobiales bacterium]|nr:DUF2637 domain-containing protein [Acidimicrobiales bacterium]